MVGVKMLIADGASKFVYLLAVPERYGQKEIVKVESSSAYCFVDLVYDVTENAIIGSPS